MTLAGVDVHDPDVWAAGVPHAILRRLRREAPVFWQERPDGRGYWALSRHADVTAASRDPATFSSAIGGTQIDDPTPEQRPMVDTMMLNLDPPRHGAVRKLVVHGFTPRMVTRLEPWIRSLARRILADAAARREVDLVADVAAELPLQVIAELMGVPAAARARLRDWSEQLIGFDDPELGRSWEGALASATEMAMYGFGLAEARRGSPGDDLVSVLVNAVVDGERLDEAQFSGLFVQLAVAGNETTRTLLAGGVLALMAHPGEAARLAADPGLVSRAVEEWLRWVTPLHYFRRTATRDCEIRGQRIRAGDRVVMLYASANRDEDVFRDPDRFDVGREPNPHLSFGFGEHFCVGAALARLEARVFLEEWLALGLAVEPAGPVRRLRSNLVNGVKSAPIRLTIR